MYYLTFKLYILKKTDFIYLLEKINELEKKIEHIENKYIYQNIGEYDVFDILKQKIKLEQGIEYINKISYVELIKEFYWDKIDMWMKCFVLEFENVEGKFSIVIKDNQEIINVGTWIKHYIVGVEIKSYKIISN